jgi:hypothetical protein
MAHGHAWEFLLSVILHMQVELWKYSGKGKLVFKPCPMLYRLYCSSMLFILGWVQVIFSFTFPVPRHGLWLFGILWWPPEQNFQSLYMWTSAFSCKYSEQNLFLVCLCMKVVIFVYFIWLCRHVKEFILAGLVWNVHILQPFACKCVLLCQYTFYCICESSAQLALDQHISIITTLIDGSIEEVHCNGQPDLHIWTS